RLNSPFLLMFPPPPSSTLFPYTTLFRSERTLSGLQRSQFHRTYRCQRKRLLAGTSMRFAHQSDTSGPEQRSSSGRHARVLRPQRSEEHTSELQSRGHLVCRLLLEKKKKK